VLKKQALNVQCVQALKEIKTMVSGRLNGADIARSETPR